MAMTSKRRRLHRRGVLWSLVAMLTLAVVLPLSGYAYTALAQESGDPRPIEPEGGVVLDSGAWQSDNPRSDTWREARQGQAGVTTVEGQETGVLIQNGGQNWRQVRNGPVATFTPWIMALSLLGIVAVYLLVGRARLQEPRSGRIVPRWALWERALHWTTATLFIVMSITGLSLLFGRAVLIPLLGPAGFAAYANFAMTLHNYIGPFFTVCVLAMIVSWIWYNIPNRTDLIWFKRGGGMIRDKHPPAGRFNGGEKGWFWFVILGGGAVCVTGLIMDFPNFGWDRSTMQISNLIHAVAGIVWIGIFFGHAYIGTLGTEGALEGMTTGSVSREWAKQHHDLWYDRVKDRERVPTDSGGGSSAPARGTPPTS